MELILDKTKEGRVLMRYEDGNYNIRWIDMGFLLKIATGEIDFDMMSDDIYNALSNYVELLRECKNINVDYQLIMEDIFKLMEIAKHLKSLDAQDRNEHTGYVGETAEIFKTTTLQI